MLRTALLALCAPLVHSLEVPLSFGVEFEYLFPEWTLNLDEPQRIASAELAMFKAGFPLWVAGSYDEAHKSVDTWKMAPDLSLGMGFEMVSPILSGKDGLAIVGQVMEAMKAYQVELSKNTDFHVHVDATGRTVEQVRNAWKNFIFFEDALDTFQPPNHRGNRNPWMQSSSAHFYSIQDAYNQLDKCDSLDCLYELAQPETPMGARVHKLNMSPHGNSMSLEFRGHHSTYSKDEAMNWVLLSTNLIQKSFDGIVADPTKTFATASAKAKYMFSLLFDSEDADRLQQFYSKKSRRIMRLARAASEDSIWTDPVKVQWEDFGVYKTQAELDEEDAILASGARVFTTKQRQRFRTTKRNRFDYKAIW